MRAPLATLLLLAGTVLGCAAPQPTSPPNAVVHFRNFSGSALLVTVGGYGPGPSDRPNAAVLRPCGGDAAVIAPVPQPDDPRIGMGALLDGTGQFDAAVASQPDALLDAKDMLESFAPWSSIIWSTAEYGFADMPLWVTFHPGTTDVSATQPSDTPPPSCAPWPPSD